MVWHSDKFKKKATGWARIALSDWYQFDFFPSFVIPPSGDNCHLHMRKSKAQGWFISDLLQLKTGVYLHVAVAAFQSFSKTACVAHAFVTCIFSGLISCTVHCNSYFLYVASAFILVNY